MRLSKHFTLGELTKTSQRADNTPSWGAILALRTLARECLEPIRAVLGGRPIIVTSGYRSPEVNKLVGGSPTSDHLQGTACDFVVSGLSSEAAMRELAVAVRAGILTVDQLIVYHPSKGGHIHVGYRGERSRGQLLRMTAGGEIVAYRED